MPGDFRCDCGDYARVLFYFAREAAGALSARHSLRPLIFWGEQFCTTRAHRAARMRSLDVIARCQRVPPSAGPMINSATKHPLLLRGNMDCFAEPVIGRAFARPVWLAMTTKLLRRGTDRRPAGWPMQVGDRYKRAQPRTESREGDVDPVLGIA